MEIRVESTKTGRDWYVRVETKRLDPKTQKPRYKTFFFPKHKSELYRRLLKVDHYDNMFNLGATLGEVQSLWDRRIIKFVPGAIPVFKRWQMNTYEISVALMNKKPEITALGKAIMEALVQAENDTPPKVLNTEHIWIDEEPAP